MAKLEVRPVGPGRSATEGKLSVSLEPPQGVFDGDTCVLSPPDAFALRISGKQIVAWRTPRKPGTSGVGRADYVWIVESYTRPALELAWTHQVRAHRFIAGYAAHSLTAPREAPDKIVTLVGGGDDDAGYLYLVPQEDGSIVETERKEEALALVGVKPKLRRDPPQLPPAAHGASLDEVIAAPEDDQARLRYASALTAANEPRGEFIRLQVEKTHRSLTPAEKKSEKALYDAHREAWGAQLGATKSGQAWERGFLVELNVGSNFAKAAMNCPEWRLVKRLPNNGILPEAAMMDSLEEAGGFNLSTWFMTRKTWPRLRSLVARPKELAILEPARFPALDTLVVYDALGVSLAEVLGRLQLRSLQLIGSLDAKKSGYDLAALWPALQDLDTIVVAPDQQTNYQATFTRSSSGWSAHVKLKRNGKPAWASDLFGLLPKQSLAAVTFDPAEPPYDVSRWLTA